MKLQKMRQKNLQEERRINKKIEVVKERRRNISHVFRRQSCYQRIHSGNFEKLID